MTCHLGEPHMFIIIFVSGSFGHIQFHFSVFWEISTYIDYITLRNTIVIDNPFLAQNTQLHAFLVVFPDPSNQNEEVFW